ncbi:hypothetical protein BG53_03985 [Paenibacillus darwinianus]|uniref:PilZ domain-containing protein n=1 Tax=Paenibacillus darwinianus TaxID=1380763 RepID=A0A9W5S143_9BACL|nr:PilZ domain-containing protein [Paenibacillus darwinianus]EXX87561.1 hypothetical protein BG53_03985 [Paenibacillus darwinianus]EXX87572.1 hypothetical protein CH50_05160 [Paenibacillus darwinianus]EXX87703.1 hypothetical protein BG52_03650 [Paenibacillus darwinianus]
MKTGEFTQERRQLRLKYPGMIWAGLSVASVACKPVRSGIRPVLILNLNTEGLHFVSSLKLPVRQDYRVGFNVDLDDRSFLLLGEVVWQTIEENLYVYGVRLIFSEQEMDELQTAMERKLRLASAEAKIHDAYRRMSEYETHIRDVAPFLDLCR